MSVACRIDMPICSRKNLLFGAVLPEISPSQPPSPLTFCPLPASTFDESSSTVCYEILTEVKKVGPSLKEVRMKMHKEWIPVWLQDPHKWRPGTKAFLTQTSVWA